jgi:hypothetical protein
MYSIFWATSKFWRNFNSSKWRFLPGFVILCLLYRITTRPISFIYKVCVCLTVMSFFVVTVFTPNVCNVKEKIPYVECWFIVRGSESPSLLVPCSKPTAQLQSPLPQLTCALPASKTFIYIQTTLTSPLLLGQTQYDTDTPVWQDAEHIIKWQPSLID